MRTRALVPVLNYQNDKLIPPDVSMWDQTEEEKARNEAYCKELQQAMYEFEMDPRNFFKLNKSR